MPFSFVACANALLIEAASVTSHVMAVDFRIEIVGNRPGHYCHLCATLAQCARNSGADPPAAAGNDLRAAPRGSDPMASSSASRPFLSYSSGRSRHLFGALDFALELYSAEVILHRPADSREAELRGCVECPLGIGEVGPADGNQVGAPCSDDAVYLICVGDVADGDSSEHGLRF
jgi:hypothetical protein